MGVVSRVSWLGSASVGCLLTLLAACSSKSSSPDAGAAPSQKDQATVDQGALSVVSRKCVECHGKNMAGAVTAIPYPQNPNVELYPPNLTPDPTTGIANWTDEQLALAIRTGVDDQGLELCPEMKHFAQMNDFETYSIIKYLRQLPPVPLKILRSVCPPLKTKEEQLAAP